MSSAQKRIFICYRRDDAEGYAGRIYDRLHARFPGRVFMDVASINPGADFSRMIQETVGSCGVLLAIIGKQWLTIADNSPTPRIQRGDDYVRREIATALTNNVHVIPVLVREAKMPPLESLPPDLASLTTRNALTISDDDFEHDALRLISAIEFVLGERRVQPAPAPPSTSGSNKTCLIVAIVGILVAFGLFIAFVFGAAFMNGASNVANNNQSYVPTETPGYSPQYSPESPPTNNNTSEVNTGEFNPVGNWILRLTGNGETHDFPLTMYSDYTYEYGNETGRWSYSGNSLTFGSGEGSTIFTIEGRYGNSYTGHALVVGNAFQAMLIPRE